MECDFLPFTTRQCCLTIARIQVKDLKVYTQSTSKQSTLKTKNAFSGILNRVHHHLPGLALYQCWYILDKFYQCYQVATLVKCKSWKVIMDLCRDPGEVVFLSLGLIVSWLLAVAP